jgi:type II secretory pathway component PulK
MSAPFPAVNRRETERGFILIFALAVCLVLALVGATMGRSVQSALRSTSAAVEVAKARALADGGVALASVRLEAGLDVSAFVCTVAGAGMVAFTIEDEAGKVPLNTDNEELLLALFQGLGVAQDDAGRYVAAIADYRDGDKIPRPNGAEADVYRAAGFAAGPKNANFATVGELDRVWGIPADVRARSKPYLTAFTSALGVDPEAAAPELIALLNGGGDAAGAAQFADRGALPARFTELSGRAIYRIHSIGMTGATRFVRDVIVARPEQRGGTVRRLSWQQGEVRPDDEARLGAAEAAPAC